MSGKINVDISNPSSCLQLQGLYGTDTFKTLVKRHAEYIKESPYGTLRGRIAPLTLIGAGGFAGFCAGTRVAQVLDAKTSKPIFQGTGTVLGCGVGAYVYLWMNEQETFFKAWKELKLDFVTNSFVFQKHAQDPFLNQFVDCINYNPIQVPVRLASGSLMDLDIFRSIKPNEEGKIICPHTRNELDINNPNIYLEAHCIILKRVQYLLQQDLLGYQPGTDIHKLTELQLITVQNKIVSSRKKHMEGIEKLEEDGKITSMELDTLRLEFYLHLGVNTLTHVMDFARDWKGFLTENSKIIFRGTPPTHFDNF